MKNPLIGYLNISSLRNNISDLRILLHDLQLEYFAISESKLDDSFPSAQFATENYEIRGRRDSDGHGGGLIEFVKSGIICKRVKQFETQFGINLFRNYHFQKEMVLYGHL